MISSASLAKSSTIVPALLRMRAVEPRQRLHGVHAAELLVHVHRVQQRLIEPSLELVGDDQETVFGPLEGLGGLRLRKTVHPGSVYDRPPSSTVPEKATSALKGYPRSARYLSTASL